MYGNIKIRDNGIILRISIENYSLSVCRESVSISNIDDNGNDLEYMHVPKALLDIYAEMYIKKHFEMSEDGWVRRIENDETV